MTTKQQILNSDIWRGLAMSYNKLNRLMGDTLDIDYQPSETEIEVRILTGHQHNADCIESDIMDLGDQGDGYVAYEVYQCKVTGEYSRDLNKLLEGFK